ncbi:MAG: hypothetical protein MUF03_11295 [Rubrivivax sp.]|jgi:hypothetical protein|nr:hypothetical protein [Rubrivivax sp.]
MHERLLHQRLVALFVLALLAFNYPLIALWDHEVTVLGLPLFPAALFGVWALLIVALAWLLESGGIDAPNAPESADEASAPPPDEGPRA